MLLLLPRHSPSLSPRLSPRLTSHLALPRLSRRTADPVSYAALLHPCHAQEWMAEERSSFWDTFSQNIWRDWREPLDIRAHLNRIADKIDPALAKLPSSAKGPYDPTYGCATIKGEERCVFTSKSLAALRTQADKAEYYERPIGVPRYQELGRDGRGLIILSSLDGTNKVCIPHPIPIPTPAPSSSPSPIAYSPSPNHTSQVESDFNRLETTESASSYKPKHAHGLLMASAERLSVKGNVAVGLQVCACARILHV